MEPFDLNKIPSQKGKLAIVTGANVGLGFETALALAKKDIEIVLACRNMNKASKAKAQIKKVYPDAKLKCLELDLSKLDSVHAFAKQFHIHYKQLDLLINNAGIMMTPYEKTVNGFEGQLAANYLGHFLLTSLMLDTLEKTEGSRTIMLSSLAHRKRTIQFDDLHFEKEYDPSAAYGQSKLACLMFAYELDKRLKANKYQTKSLAVHPGVTLTNLISHFNPFIKLIAKFIDPLLFASTKKAALPTLRGALDPDIQGGEYIGPGGFREFKGPPVIVGSNKISKDPKARKKLWDLSEKLVKKQLFESV
ncbi:unnamed protein product [Chrysoparadoxa australica]